ncbi:hypothetical protein GCM10010885_02170 [Alicyclobacillus cellulosilyticus]|uniref:YqhG n=1 Tax=Alicyclobacillus cellulosilyticus TaxID=1003997 RepID=A0A917NGI7_9BACL|nr:YqhG family protein [Alicyclobacillus cellulosilyticus]GGI96047.1 hypothetical protein GCM10010885_02170 [Alicyclobacillus cellulosilyticus]
MNHALPLRTPEERQAFCEAYFAAVGAKCVYQAEAYREFELPRDVDKELTDRPYYWLWVEQTGQVVPPTVLRLAFTEDAAERENVRLRTEALASPSYQQLSDLEKQFFRPPVSELMTLGSFRFEKLMASVASRGRFASVRPADANAHRTVPWLMVNVRITRRCDLNEQSLWSVGCCLVNRQVVDGFYDAVHRLAMVPCPPRQLLSEARIGLQEAFTAVTQHVERRLRTEPHAWAREAQRRLDDELRQVCTYYQSLLPEVTEEERTILQVERTKKERDVRERYTPRLEVEPVQLALVGLLERI